MTIAPSPTSRFQILERPIRHPGKCAVCGNAQVPVVDFGLTVPGYGVVYFCLADLNDLARTIGMVNESEVSELRAAAEQSFLAYCHKNNFRVVRGEWYDAVSSAIGRLSAIGDDSGLYSGPPTDESAGAEVPADPSSAERTESDDDSGDTESTGQDSDSPVDEGSSSVPASSDDEPAGFTF